MFQDYIYIIYQEHSGDVREIKNIMATCIMSVTCRLLLGWANTVAHSMLKERNRTVVCPHFPHVSLFKVVSVAEKNRSFGMWLVGWPLDGHC